MNEASNLSSLSTDTASQLDILGHDCDTFGVDGAQVGVFKQTNKVSFGRLLESHDGRRLEAEIGLEVLGDFTYQTLEGQFPDQKLGALLVTTDFTKSDSSRSVSVRFLYTPGGWCTLTSGLCSQLLSWGLASSGFTGCLLSTCHLDSQVVTENFGDYHQPLSSFVYPPCVPPNLLIG